MCWPHQLTANLFIRMIDATPQRHQDDWHWQWDHFYDDSLFLFTEWIWPRTLEDFRGKTVVDCGCGGGQHINFVAPVAAAVTGIDLNTTDIARRQTATHTNVQFLEGDLATMTVPTQYDVGYCIGVIQHTDNPDRTFANIKKFIKPGGLLIVWCYSKEGNWLNWAVLERLKRWFLLRLPKPVLKQLATVLTFLIHPIVHTIYRLPLKFLPYYEYFDNWRKLSFWRNQLNVFDKLNAPVTNFITRDQVGGWFNEDEFTDIHITPYKGVSWRASGRKK